MEIAPPEVAGANSRRSSHSCFPLQSQSKIQNPKSKIADGPEAGRHLKCSASRMPTRGWIFIFLFFCSGAAALVYEVVWSKYLGQMFGSTVYAQTVVLAVFMGGLALGNSIFGRRSDRIRSPIKVYAYVELAIGLYAF